VVKNANLKTILQNQNMTFMMMLSVCVRMTICRMRKTCAS